ncbi:MAG: hypothetical protein LBR69_06220 [Endomicrobium sp.]|jgi:phosphohistidine swiveling domain-containing protein|nr:hypothetical protein [Endomicrobium sp.]
MILSLDPAARAAFIRALNYNQDVNEINFENLTPDTIAGIREIARNVREAKLLESDENGDITESLIRIIDLNLPEDSEYKNKVTKELLEKTDLSALAKAIENGGNAESLLRIAEIDNPLLRQYKIIAEMLTEYKNKFLNLSSQKENIDKLRKLYGSGNLTRILDGIDERYKDRYAAIMIALKTANPSISVKDAMSWAFDNAEHEAFDKVLSEKYYAVWAMLQQYEIYRQEKENVTDYFDKIIVCMEEVKVRDKATAGTLDCIGFNKKISAGELAQLKDIEKLIADITNAKLSLNIASADIDALRQLNAIRHQGIKITREIYIAVLLGLDYGQIRQELYAYHEDIDAMILKNALPGDSFTGVLGSINGDYAVISGKLVPIDTERKLEEVFSAAGNEQMTRKNAADIIRDNALAITDFYSFYNIVKQKNNEARAIDGKNLKELLGENGEALEDALLFGLNAYGGDDNFLRFWSEVFGMQHWTLFLKDDMPDSSQWNIEGYRAILPKLFERAASEKKKIVFLLPPKLDYEAEGYTSEEIKYLLDHPEVMEHVVFVVGAYDFFDVDISPNESKLTAHELIAKILDNKERYITPETDGQTEVKKKRSFEEMAEAYRERAASAAEESAEPQSREEVNKNIDKSEKSGTNIVSKISRWILGLLLAVTLVSSISLGAFAVSDTGSGSSPRSSITAMSGVSDSTASSEENQALFESFETLKENTFFQPGSAGAENISDPAKRIEYLKSKFKESLELSNSEAVKARVNAVIERLRGLESLKAMGFNIGDLKVFITVGSLAGTEYPAAIDLDLNIILISLEHFSPDSEFAKYGLNISLDALIAHEVMHTVDKHKVESGEMSRLESERRAMLAGALAVPNPAETIEIDGQKVDAVEGRKAIAFGAAVDNREQVENEFKKFDKNADFFNIYYQGVFRTHISQEEYDKLSPKLKEYFNPDLKENEIELTLKTDSNSTAITYAVNYETSAMEIIRITDNGVERQVRSSARSQESAPAADVSERSLRGGSAVADMETDPLTGAGASAADDTSTASETGSMKSVPVSAGIIPFVIASLGIFWKKIRMSIAKKTKSSMKDAPFIFETIKNNNSGNIAGLLGEEKIKGIIDAVLSSFANDNWSIHASNPPVYTVYDNLIRAEDVLKVISESVRDGKIDVGLLIKSFSSDKYTHKKANNLLDGIFTALFGFETQVFEFGEEISLHINIDVQKESFPDTIEINENDYVAVDRPAGVLKPDYFHGTSNKNAAEIVNGKKLKVTGRIAPNVKNELGVFFANNVNLSIGYSRDGSGVVFGFTGNIDPGTAGDVSKLDMHGFYNVGSVVYRNTASGVRSDSLIDHQYFLSGNSSGNLGEIIFFSREAMDLFLENLTEGDINFLKAQGVALRFVSGNEDTYYSGEKLNGKIKEIQDAAAVQDSAQSSEYKGITQLRANRDLLINEMPDFEDGIRDRLIINSYKEAFDAIDREVAENWDKIPEEDLKSMYSAEEIEYLEILRKPAEDLSDMVKNESLSILHRLYAAMLLKADGESIDERTSEALKNEFLTYIKDKYDRDKEVSNRYELQALLTGVHLTILFNAGEEAGVFDSVNVYKEISRALIVRGNNADSSFVFSRSNAELSVMAHELGHVYLMETGVIPKREGDKSIKTIHELFADSISGFFLQTAGLGSKISLLHNQGIGFRLNKSDYGRVQEEHTAARGFENIIKAVFKLFGNTEPEWGNVAVLVWDFIVNSGFNFSGSQAEMFESFIERYADKFLKDVSAERIKTAFDALQEAKDVDNDYIQIGDEIFFSVSEFRDRFKQIKLELDFSAKLADKLGLRADGNLLQKVLRGAFVGIVESPLSILPFFVKMHYGRAGPTQEDKQSGAYKSRAAGNVLIKAFTAAGIAISVALSLSSPLAFLLPLALNVITHAIYNLSVSEEKRLEFGSAQNLSWNEKARQVLSQLDNVIASFNTSRYYDDSNNPFKKAGWHKWDKIRGDFQRAADEKSFREALNNFLAFESEAVSNMDYSNALDFINLVYAVTGILPLNLPLSAGSGTVSLTKVSDRKQDAQSADAFSLFERFIDFNKIALSELGSGNEIAVSNSQKALVEMINILKELGDDKISSEAEKRLANVTGAADLNGIINYVHQGGIGIIKRKGAAGSAEKFKFDTVRIDRSLESSPGEYDFDIEVYNYSEKPLNEDMIEFLSNLRLKSLPRWGRGRTGFSLFVKDNAVIFDMHMGEHSSYSVIHLDDLNQGMYGVYNESSRRFGNTMRTAMFARAAASVGMDITRFDVLKNNIYIDGYRSKSLISALYKYMKESERENPDENLLEQHLTGIQRLSGKDGYIADKILNILSSKTLKALNSRDINAIISSMGIKIYSSGYLFAEKISAQINGKEQQRDMMKSVAQQEPLFSPENNMVEDFIRKMKTYADAVKRNSPKGIESAKKDLKAYSDIVNNRAEQIMAQFPDGWQDELQKNQIMSARNGIINAIEHILSQGEGAADSAVAESYKKRLEKGYLKRQLGIIDGILRKKYGKGIESIDEISDANISLKVAGVGGFNMAYRAGDRLSAPRYYADMLSKLILILAESGGLDRTLEGYTDNPAIDPNEGAGDFDLSDALRLGFIEQDELKPQQLQDLRQRRGNYDFSEDPSGWFKERFRGVSDINPVMNSIERKFAEGSITADGGSFTENAQYEPIETITKALADNPELVFEQGNVISYLLDTQLSLSDFSFTEEGNIGRMTALSGVLRLKGGYLSVKAVQDPATNKIYCVYSEFADISGKRNALTVSGLTELLKNNGFQLNEREFPAVSEKEKKYVFKQLRRSPLEFKFQLQSSGQFVYRGQKAGVVTYDESKLDKDKIWVVSQIAPDDRTAMSKAGGVVTNGGNKYSHIGVLTREAKVPSVFLPRGMMRDGKMSIPLITSVRTQTSNGFPSVIVSRTSREIQEGDFVVIDGDKVYVLNEEERLQFETAGMPVDLKEMEYMLEDAIEAADILFARNNAVDALKAFTVIIGAEEIIRDSKVKINGKLKRESLKTKRKAFSSIQDYAKEITEDIETILGKESLSAQEAEKLFKYHEMFSVWQNFYGMPEIAELSRKISVKINALKKTTGSLQSVGDLGIEYADDIGSKAANVARLIKMFDGKKYNGIGVRVPGGSTMGYSVIKDILGQDFLKLILDLKSAVEPENQNPDAAYELTTLKNGMPGKIPNLINGKNIGNKLKSLGIEELRDLVYAVRSTGVGEDSVLNAFAGMGETELNVRRDEAEDAIIKVLTSFFAKRSVDYMLETHKVVLPAVFIQEMVQDVALAGQIFSSNNEGNLEMEGVFGLGEGSVSGRVEADNMTFKTADDIVSYRKAGARIMKIVPSEDGGTKAVPSIGDEKYKEVFTADIIKALMEMAREIEQEFGYSADVEFAVGENGVISLLQTRPITMFVKEGYIASQDEDLTDLVKAAQSERGQQIRQTANVQPSTVSAAADGVNRAANPAQSAKTAQKIAVRLVSSKEREALKSEEINLEENLVIAESIEQAMALKSQGFNVAVIDGIERSAITFGGIVLTDADDRKIGKAKVSEDESGIIHFEIRSRNGNVSPEEVKASIEKMVSEGMAHDMLKSKGIVQVVAAENAETLQEVLGRMRNIERDRRNRKTKEAVLYINGRVISGEFERFCTENYKNNNIGVYVIDSQQQMENKEAINRLTESGIRFVLLKTADEVSENMEFELDGVMVEAQRVNSYEEASELMRKLQAAKNKAKNGMDLRITIKFDAEKILKELMERDDFDKSKYEGIMIVGERGLLGGERVKKLGKLEIDVNGGISDEVLENSRVAAIGSNNEEVFQNANTKERREKAKSVKEKFEQGEKAAWGNKFDDTADIFALEEIITTLTPEDENLKAKIDEFAGRANNGLSTEAQSYLRHLTDRDRHIEALGFIRGTALNTVGKELEPILRAMGIDTDKLKGNDNLYRGLLIKGLQIKLEIMREGISLEEALKEKDGQWINETAQTYLDRIISAVNADIEKTLSENEYKIEKLKGKEAVAKAIEGLKDLNVLLQDKFRLREVPKEIKISTLAVRNILAAA